LPEEFCEVVQAVREANETCRPGRIFRTVEATKRNTLDPTLAEMSAIFRDQKRVRNRLGRSTAGDSKLDII
jgi:hypothetical protein